MKKQRRRMRHFITVQQDNSADGAEAADWGTQLYSWPATVVAVSGLEKYRGHQVEATTSHMVETRYHKNIIPNRRIIHGSKTLNISSVVPDERERYVMVKCTEVTV